MHAPSIEKLLDETVRHSKIKPAFETNILPAAKRNLKLLQTTLAENPLSSLQKRVILRTINDGVFGESYATDVEQNQSGVASKYFLNRVKCASGEGRLSTVQTSLFGKDSLTWRWE